MEQKGGLIDMHKFYNEIADVQFFYGERPDDDTVNHTLTED